MKKLAFTCFILLINCNTSKNLEFKKKFVQNNSELSELLDNNEIQLKLTVIDEHKGFKEYEYNVDSEKYFYPASTVKLPIALFALEKLNEHKNLSIDTPFMLEDDTLKTTIRRELEKIFILSDNQANNRLFEFLGQDYINNQLISKGFNNARIFHRLSTSNSSKLKSKRVDFFLKDSMISFQNDNQIVNKLNLKNLKKGVGYINSEDTMVNNSMDFSYKNFISIDNLHRIIKILFFSENFYEANRFNLTKKQKELVFKYMSGYPKEFGYDSKEYPYFFNKFFIYGDEELQFSDSFKIYNKVGLAYGQLTDTALIIKDGKSIILTATINVNTNGIYNDDLYDYDSVGFPFLAQVSREILKNIN